jgi:Tol biopolymer transport system component
MDTDGGNARMLFRNPEDMFPDLAPTWSPDGARILFTAVAGVTRDDVGKEKMTYEIRSCSANGDDVRPIIKLRGMALGWSPDGSKILCTRESGESIQLHIVSIEQGESVPLVEGKGKTLAASWAARRIPGE